MTPNTAQWINSWFLFVLDSHSSQLYCSLGQQQQRKKKFKLGRIRPFRQTFCPQRKLKTQNMKDSLLFITGNGLGHLNSWASLWFPQGNLKLLSTTSTVAPPCGQTFTCIKNKIQNHIPVLFFYLLLNFLQVSFQQPATESRKEKTWRKRQIFSIFIDFCFLDSFFSSVTHNGSLQWYILHNLSLVARRRQSEAGQGPAGQATPSNSWQENVCVRLC